MPDLLLASSSPYRRQLLARLGLPFEHRSPDIDETPRPGEAPHALACRLAESKANALHDPEQPDRLIIGSDQVASLGDQLLGKPGNHERAVAQLSAASGQTVTFYTGLCLHDSRTNQSQTRCDTIVVKFRELTPAQIDLYLKIEQPYDCAGSFKAEGLGIRLFESLSGSDPNTLIGLPLIALCDLLIEAGLDPLGG